MPVDNSSMYNEAYYQNYSGHPYKDYDYWYKFFKNIAERIVENYKPKTVLDAGCATGYLVKCLRDLSVEAYGIDISEYAISNVPNEIKSFCKVSSVTEPLPTDFIQEYDLIITLECIEHLNSQDGLKAITNLCNYSDKIIFSSSSDAIYDNTHLNVQQLEYWCEAFAANSFFHELSEDLSFISPYAAMFIKSNSIKPIIGQYEREIRILKHSLSELNNPKRNYQISSTLYFDMGNGFVETNKKEIIFDYNNYDRSISIRTDIPKDVKRIRFDPVEGKLIYLKDLEILSNKGLIGFHNDKGISIGKYEIFRDFDPQLIFDICDNSIYALSISGYMIILESEHNIGLLNQFIDEYLAADEIERMRFSDKSLLSNFDALNSIINELVKMRDNNIFVRSKSVENVICQNSEVSSIEVRKTDSDNLISKKYEGEIERLLKTNIDMENKYNELLRTHNEVLRSKFWRLSKPIRAFIDIAKYKLFHNVIKLFQSIRRIGIKGTLKKIKNKYSKANNNHMTVYDYLSINSHEKDSAYKLNINSNLLISIITPTYNTKNEYLLELYSSLKNQTYENWELCIADGNSISETKEAIRRLQNQDNRIKVVLLDDNKGIAGNTIEAFKISKGQFIVLLDHDDLLTNDALFEVANCYYNEPNVDFIYSDKGVFSDTTKEILAFHYLPQFSPDYLRGCNYASHLNAFSRSIIEEVGFIRSGYDGSQDYDFELRVIEKARNVVGIQKVLYFCRACEGSVALNPQNKMYAYEAGRKAIKEHIERIGFPGSVDFIQETYSYRIHYNLLQNLKISIIIPNKDHIKDLKRCIDSIIKKSTYPNYEIIVVENNSIMKETFDYYDDLRRAYSDKVKIIYYPNSGFNYSAINNWAVNQVSTDVILLLNNDVEIINENWLEEMLMFAQRPDVGAVGAFLFYEDYTFQHIGLYIGLGGHIASHYDHGKNGNETGYMNKLAMPQNYSAVTAACMMVKKEDYIAVNGMDEEKFRISLNDVDFCLKLREIRKINVITPYAKLYHYESRSRGSDEHGENKERFSIEKKKFIEKWARYFERPDPYYNPNII